MADTTKLAGRPLRRLAMPPVLLITHQKLDAAVDIAYELHSRDVKGKKTYKTDAERVAFLFELYQRLTSLLPADKPKKSAKNTVSRHRICAKCYVYRSNTVAHDTVSAVARFAYQARDSQHSPLPFIAKGCQWAAGFGAADLASRL
jgi:hypothetical protein